MTGSLATTIFLDTVHNASWELQLSATDYVELRVYFTGDSTMPINSADLSATWLAP
jgi:hypothetical protein